MARKILVTGGTGLVGRALQDVVAESETKDQWIFLSSKDADLTDFKQTESLFETYKPNTVIHLAANVGGLFKNLNANADMFFANMDINMNVIKLCEKYEVDKVVSCLSTCVFPDKIELPLTETQLHNGPPHSSNRGYAYAKRMLDVMSSCVDSDGTRYINIIPTNIYGPYDNWNLEDSHVIPAIVHKMYLAQQKGENLGLKGTGKPLRQFLYSYDLAQIILRLIDRKDRVGNIIVSTDPDDEMSIQDVSNHISRSFGFEYEVVFNNRSEDDGQYRKTCSNQKLRELFPDFTFTPFEHGIRETIEWFKNNYATLRK